MGAFDPVFSSLLGVRMPQDGIQKCQILGKVMQSVFHPFLAPPSAPGSHHVFVVVVVILNAWASY